MSCVRYVCRARGMSAHDGSYGSHGTHVCITNAGHCVGRGAEGSGEGMGGGRGRGGIEGYCRSDTNTVHDGARVCDTSGSMLVSMLVASTVASTVGRG